MMKKKNIMMMSGMRYIKKDLKNLKNIKRKE